MRKLTTVEFIKKANCVHNGVYDYSKVQYDNANTNVIIICKEHGEFSQNPNHHTNRKIGCPICSISIGASKRKKSTSWFIEESQKIHGSKYDYTHSIYTGQQNTINIICHTHGLFKQRPSDHIYGAHGCPICGQVISNKKQTKTIKQFVQDAHEIHGTTKYKYDSTYYVNNATKIAIQCHIHGIFNQTPANHLNGSGCPKCAGTRGEQIIITILDAHNINYEFQHKFDDCVSLNGWKLSFDFYIPNNQTIIEFDGELHYHYIQHFHGNIDNFIALQKRDSIKNDYAISNNLTIIRVNELNYSNLKRKLYRLIF